MHEPVITWNLFVTIGIVPLSVGILGLFIKKGFESWQTGWRKYEDEKQHNHDEWKAQLVNQLARGSETMQSLERRLANAITRSECDESHAELYEKIDDHGGRIVALEVNVKHLQRGPK